MWISLCESDGVQYTNSGGTQVAAFTENECSGSKGGEEAAAAAQPLVLVHLLRPLHFANVQLGSNWIGLVVVFPVVPKVQSLSLQDQLLSLYRGTFLRFPREGGDSAASEGTDCTVLTGPGQAGAEIADGQDWTRFCQSGIAQSSGDVVTHTFSAPESSEWFQTRLDQGLEIWCNLL